ncbi:MAG: A24 family peptidase C-terminal domain-containing protein [Candidatus Caldarchaeum sp.]
MEPWSTAIVSLTLLYSSYLDIRKREVDDIVWIFPSILGLLLNIYTVYVLGLDYLVRYGAAVLVSAGVGFALYYAGLYGGADAKALVTIALVQPFTYTGLQLHGVTALTVLTNGMIFSLSLPLFFAAFNSYRLLRGEKIFSGFDGEKGLRKLAALFLGTRMKKAAGKNFWGVIESVENGVRRFRFNIGIEELEKVDRDDVWVTPGIPLLVFFTAGYFFNLLAGDVMAYLFKSLTPNPI